MSEICMLQICSLFRRICLW